MILKFLIFWGIFVLFFKVTTPIYSPTNTIWGFPFLHILVFVLFCVCLELVIISLGSSCTIGAFMIIKNASCPIFGMWIQGSTCTSLYFIFLILGHCLVTFSKYISKCLGFTNEMTKLTLYEWDNFKYCFITLTIFPSNCIPIEEIAYNYTHYQNYL